MNLCQKHGSAYVVYDCVECPICEALKPKLTVRVGNRYKARNGAVYDIYKCTIDEWDADGRCALKGCGGLPCPNDLIEDLGQTPLEIEVGKWYEDTEGDKAFVFRKNMDGGFRAVWYLFECVFSVSKNGTSENGTKFVKEVAE